MGIQIESNQLSTQLKHKKLYPTYWLSPKDMKMLPNRLPIQQRFSVNFPTYFKSPKILALPRMKV